MQIDILQEEKRLEDVSTYCLKKNVHTTRNKD